MLERHPHALHKRTETTPEERDVLRAGVCIGRLQSVSGALEVVGPPGVLLARHVTRAMVRV